MKFSSNQIAKAIANCDDIVKQNQTCEIINVDITDMMNQALNFELDGVPKPEYSTPKTTEEVQVLFAQAALRLRVILAKIKESQ